MFVTGGPPAGGGGGIPQRIIESSRSTPALRYRRRAIRKDARHRRQVADVPIYHPEESDDGCLVRGD
jgi:hypothetical protein